MENNMNKRKLYESIMTNVAKQVKKTLNESYAGEEYSDDNPFLGALMNLDDVRKSIDAEGSSETYSKYEQLLDQLEKEADAWEAQHKNNKKQIIKYDEDELDELDEEDANEFEEYLTDLVFHPTSAKYNGNNQIYTSVINFKNADGTRYNEISSYAMIIAFDNEKDKLNFDNIINTKYKSMFRNIDNYSEMHTEQGQSYWSYYRDNVSDKLDEYYRNIVNDSKNKCLIVQMYNDNDEDSTDFYLTIYKSIPTVNDLSREFVNLYNNAKEFNSNSDIEYHNVVFKQNINIK